jgi:molybdopterin-guanine dinucleotide biosynthesis protein A
MGVPKATLSWEGATLIEAVVGRLAALAGEVLVVGGPPELVALPGLYGSRWVPDREPAAGPLGGLAAALAAAGHRWVALVACDMPMVRSEVWETLLKLRGSNSAVLPQELPEHPEPLHALYSRRCLGAIERSLAQGERSMTAWLGEVPHLLVPTSRLGPGAARSWVNLNTRAELEGARGGSLRAS